MTRWERWAFNGLTLAVTISGFAYLWMRYVIQSDDPFAVVNHPWQSTMLGLHVLVSPLLLLTFGVIFRSHILKKLQTSQQVSNRRSGLTALGTFAAMGASGYLLQVATSDAWLTALLVVHVASASLFTLVYVGHLLISFGMLRARPRAAVRSAA